MASILFLAPADLGETVLATGALAHVLREGEENEVTVICDPEAAALFRAVPGLAEVRVIRPNARRLFWWELLAGGKQGRENLWDIGIDARGGFAGRLLGLRLRRGIARSRIVRHRVDDWTEAFSAERPLAPKLWLDDQARKDAAQVAGDAAPLLILAPGGVSSAKRWPRERFAAVARRLVDGALAGARIAVIGAAARDGEITRAVVSSLDADGIAALDLGAAPDLLAAAALMERATISIGNDNALTHIAAAAGAPTLTIFGVTDERVRAPYGPRTRTLRGRPFEEVAALSELDAPAAMEDVSVDAVEAAALELLHAGGLR